MGKKQQIGLLSKLSNKEKAKLRKFLQQAPKNGCYKHTARYATRTRNGKFEWGSLFIELLPCGVKFTEVLDSEFEADRGLNYGFNLEGQLP